MSTPLLSLDDPAATDPTRCGHKAATLAALRQAGHPVPEGFVLPVDAEAGLTAAHLAEVLDALAGPVAVRSSGVAEDLPDASWAGQYDTVLGVEGTDAVLRAVRKVLASARSDRARTYGTAGGLAVLIQRMVPADAAGVAFSANPVTGNRGEVVISAVAGLAEKLVSGEASGETWRVTDEARAEGQAHALDAETAHRIADLARTLEDERGAPQDVEWAVVAGEVILLQSRPITALPVAPEIEPPADGIWMKDAAHFSGPITPFGASVYVPPFDSATRQMCALWGLMVDRVEMKVIGHELYSHAVPFGGGSETASPPPWWALAIASRLVPSIRKRLAVGHEALASGLHDRIPDEWLATGRDALLDELAAHRSVDPTALDDDALDRHVDELVAFGSRCQHLHFRLFIPYVLGVHGLCDACTDLLGWDEAEALQLVQGLSTASSAPTEALAGLADALRAREAARACIASDPDWPNTLPGVDPDAHGLIETYRSEWGLRTVEYDPGSPTLAERIDVFAALIRDAVVDGLEVAAQEQARQAKIAEARGRLSGDALARFDQALAYAEKTYPIREDNVLLTDNMPSGLLRRAGLELGRRLVALGRLDRAEDAMMLSLDELRTARTAPDGHLELARRRKAELAWVRANPGPGRYGPEPGAPPDVRGLIPSGRRLNGAMLWMMGLELVPPSAGEGDLAGIGACAGTYRGRVRVITDAADLHTLERGEVLVCPVTTPAWSVVFTQAGALVTDGGSVLSHAAIISREHAVPCVVATGDSTRRLQTGMEVTVDGSAGTVTVHA